MRPFLLGILLLVATFSFASPSPGSLRLTSGWAIQSSCKVEEKGDIISTVKFHPSDWYKASVPGGVLANLVADKVYPEPYNRMNVRQIPGATYPVGTLFANQPMPDDSPFKCPWWYRLEFSVDSHPGKTGFGGQLEQKWLHFDGINYRANIWLNGKLIASNKDVAGAYRAYEFNVTDALAKGKNVLAVEVSAPTEKDLGINWVDWNPTPPDKNMGLWRDVWLSFSGPAAVRNARVIGDLSVPDLSTATLMVTAELRNATDHALKGMAQALIESVRLSQPVELAAGESKIVTFAPSQYPQLVLKKPRVWWPAPLGAQNLYSATISFEQNGRISDSQTVTFGIRKIISELNDKGYRQFKINGKNILIRGAGWTPDMLLNASQERVEQELRYVRHLNLNTVRLEGKMETDHFYDTADRMGILIMAGWCCCDAWEKWKDWTDETHTVANESLRTQITRLRNHPSALVWLNGSDNPPPPDVESGYLAIEKELNWPNPILSSATAQTTTVTGASGVKMSGPYEFVPPSYWLADTGQHGGAYGFNSETSPGPAVPPIESLREMVGQEHLWPVDDVWKFHCGGGSFKTLDIFTSEMNARYGEAHNAREFAVKSQAMTYDGERAMFEAYGRNKYTSTGVIQWMLNNAWPSMIWHLYDWYLMPAGGYFGARKANEPLHVQYSSDDASVVVVNNLYEPFHDLRVSAEVYNVDMTPKFARQATVDVAEDAVKVAMTIPALEGLSTTYFLKLSLQDRAGKQVSSNFYWLSTTADVLDWAKTNYYVTPVTQHADMKELNDLPTVDVEATAETRVQGSDKVTRVVLRNPSKGLAFMVRLRLLGKDGKDLLPVLWDDNFFELLPGEKRELSGRVAARQSDGAPTLRVEGWNVRPKNIAAR